MTRKARVTLASMGPQSGSCGYLHRAVGAAEVHRLQWVHSLVAVVMAQPAVGSRATAGASMGPQSGSCGYGGIASTSTLSPVLQWVHSLVAVVIVAAGAGGSIYLMVDPFV